MTRETKIGLLVGLAFIIVIGILLSDHFRGTQEPAGATLDRAGATVRQTVNAPGANVAGPPVAVAPVEVDPRSSVQTPRDIDPTPSPVVAAPRTSQLPQSNLQPTDPLVQAARQQGEEIVSADGSTTTSTSAVALRSYEAQDGDTVSRMASKFMGSSSYKNVKAIIAANPSLQADPNKVIVGQSYIIPSAAGASIASSAATTSAVAAGQTMAPAGGWTYTVKSGDTLWGIATGQLGNANAISAIKDLNAGILHGGNNVRPGMKLRLPSQPLAIAD